MSKALVDTSIWINYFRNKKQHNKLISLIEQDIICTNQIILSELVPSLIHSKQNELLEIIQNVEIIPVIIDWEIIINYQVLNLANGINKVGLIDLVIVQNTIDNNLILYSNDTHFNLMSKILKFEVFEE